MNCYDKYGKLGVWDKGCLRIRFIDSSLHSCSLSKTRTKQHCSGSLHTFQIIAGNKQRISTANTHDEAPTKEWFRVAPFLHCPQGKRVDQPVETYDGLREKGSDIATPNGSWSYEYVVYGGG
jgi:hypothetical protein